MKREAWIDDLLDSLAKLADVGLQTRAWITGEHRDFFPDAAELACRVFDDEVIVNMVKAGASVFSPEIDETFRRLDVATDSCDLYDDPLRLLRDPNWLRAVELSALAFRLLSELSWED